MIFRLWHKLVLAIAGITGVVLILALFISDQSVKKGFLSYINQVESNRLDSLVQNLVEGYKNNSDWEFIRDNRTLWHRYNQRVQSPLPISREKRKNTLPPLRQLANRSGDEGVPPRFPKRPNSPRPLSTDSLADNLPPPPEEGGFSGRPLPPPRGIGSDRGPPPPRGIGNERGPRPGGRRPPPPRNLVLLDKSKKFIVGRLSPEHTSEAMLRPIILNETEIGYLQFEPFTKFTVELDKQFIQYQNHAFLKIFFLALGFILLGAALLAAYFRSRINGIGDHAGLLTSGDFSPQTLDGSSDELGQLSHKLDILGKTLSDNQLIRRRWVSDISHELRTPVAVLQGEIEAMQDGVRKLTPDSIDSLHHEILRLSRLVNDLHELSMSDMGALSYNKEATNIVEIIQDVISSHEVKFDDKQISTNIKAAKESIRVIGDWQRLEQLFSNLANNSCHYTSNGGSVVIHISQQKDTVLIKWADSSPGVEDKDLTKLFDRLYRVDASRDRNTGGSGLGLAICKNIVEAHDGKIDASHSELGGVVFTITFPLLKI